MKLSYEIQLIVKIHDGAKLLSCGNKVDIILALLKHKKEKKGVPHARFLHKLNYYLMLDILNSFNLE